VRDPDGPYETLGLASDATDAEIKLRYRELVKRHHPDALLSKGVPPEFLIAAERRLAAVTAAYEAIQLERGKRAAQVLEKGA
jgi:DnaJ like chaperone protein